MIPRRTAFSLLAATLLAMTSQPAHAQVPDGYREMSFGAFTRNGFVRELPVRFRVPEGYVALQVEGGGTRTYWTSPADSAAYAADPDHAYRDGFYSVDLSLNVGYDAENDIFFGSGVDESTFRAMMEAEGYTDVRLERHRVNGHPVLFTEAVNPAGRRARLVYVAALLDTNVVFVYYTHPQTFRELDQARWDELKRGILASPPPAVPTR